MARRPKSVRFIALLTLCLSALAAFDAFAQAIAFRPWLGLAMVGDAAGRGARVGHVVRSSPAERAGVREGDRVTRVARTNIVRPEDVVRAVSGLMVGEVVEVAFLRAGKEQTARATLAPFPSSDVLMRMELVGTVAPDWSDVDGVSGTFPDSIGALRGRVVILDFWATWCAPCRIVAPKLSALQSRYGAQGLTVLGLSTEDMEKVAVFARRTAMAYAIGVDKNAKTTQAYGVGSLPTLVVIDRRGVVRDVSIGYDLSEDAALDAAIRGLLAEPGLPH
ncbi:MAG: redoxin domain-containing protein [Myxococcota bacterium]|nr:redoxin domain-containing protein [Myxococcota bacterium]